MPRSRPLYVGVDTGGTFTDFVSVRDGTSSVLKIPSTPRDPAAAVLTGLARLAGPASVVLCYGSTVATNALLERRGARVVLVTTAGFEDVIEIGRQTRPALYDLAPVKAVPLVPRRRRLGVAERTLFDGTVIAPLTRAHAAAVARRAARFGAEAVAVCLLHAYANPAHERRLARALAHLGVPVSLSHTLVREYREYERLSTTVVNAYVAPVVGNHLDALTRGVPGLVRVMLSSGGLVASGLARDEPVRTILSGPAGGVIGALTVAERARISRIMTLDMGGTSTDVCLVDRVPARRADTNVGGIPVKTPAIDIHTVGAGGGSIATLDAGGSLKVGPESAGADPGPACYGHGTQPTVTDANLVLGRLVAEEFLGGGMRIDAARARAAVDRLARHAGLELMVAAEGIVRVVNASMERALRLVSVERGFDPRDFTLVAFGGAAGLHACALAEALEIPGVLVPRDPGLLSAWGILYADIVRDYVQTVRRTGVPWRALTSAFTSLEARARRELGREVTDLRRLRFVRSLDTRYPGQSYELEVPYGSGYVAAFHRTHARRYGSADSARPVEVVAVRLRALVTTAAPRSANARLPPPRPGGAAPLSRAAHAHVFWRGRRVPAARVHRDTLGDGRRLSGPAVICEFSSTTWVPPGWTARLDGDANLRLDPVSRTARGRRATRRDRSDPAATAWPPQPRAPSMGG